MENKIVQASASSTIIKDSSVKGLRFTIEDFKASYVRVEYNTASSSKVQSKQ